MKSCFATTSTPKSPKYETANTVSMFDLTKSLEKIKLSSNCRNEKMILRPRLVDEINVHHVEKFISRRILITTWLAKFWSMPDVKLVHLRKKHNFVSF